MEQSESLLSVGNEKVNEEMCPKRCSPSSPSFTIAFQMISATSLELAGDASMSTSRGLDAARLDSVIVQTVNMCNLLERLSESIQPARISRSFFKLSPDTGHGAEASRRRISSTIDRREYFSRSSMILNTKSIVRFVDAMRCSSARTSGSSLPIRHRLLLLFKSDEYTSTCPKVNGQVGDMGGMAEPAVKA